MLVHLIAIGNRMPDWVELGYEEYARRMPPECRLRLTEIPAGKRGKSVDIQRILQQEGEKMLAAIPQGNEVIALDVGGRHWSTEQLAEQMESWMQQGRDTTLLVGGPEGLAPACRQRADRLWSLSAMTFPHPLVRVILAEQLYRATTILKNHPYHK